MSATYRIYPDHGLLVTLLSGEVTEEDLLEQQRQLRTDPAFRPDMRQLVDASRVTGSTLNSTGVRNAARNTTLELRARRAVFVTRAAHYGLARMFQLMLGDGDEHFAVFDDRAAAYRWLGLAEDFEP